MAATLIVLILGCCLLMVSSIPCLLGPLPHHALVSCEHRENKLVCQATCTKGYMFRSLELKVLAICDLDTGQWDVVIRDCVASCRTPLLGITPGIFNITASSVYMNRTDKFGPEMARFAREGGVWRPEAEDRDQYFQITFPGLYRITGVVTKGDEVDKYLTAYRMLFSMDGLTWFSYADPSTSDKRFRGNSEYSERHTEPLPCPHTSRHVRLNPVEWTNHIAMKLDVLGCPYQRHLHVSTASPNISSVADKCRAAPPPDNAAISCERKDGIISCTYTCKKGFAFENTGKTQPIVTTRQCTGHESEHESVPIPECVEGTSKQQSNSNTSVSCLQESIDCSNMPNGDYQFCADCHYFGTCAEFVFYVRACPAELRFNGESRRCDYSSNTCDTGSRTTPPSG